MGRGGIPPIRPTTITLLDTWRLEPYLPSVRASLLASHGVMHGATHAGGTATLTSISTETPISTGTSTEIDTGGTGDRVANGGTTRSIATGEDLKPPGLGTLSVVERRKAERIWPEVGRTNLKVAGVLANEEPVTAKQCVGRAKPAEQAVVADRFEASQEVAADRFNASQEVAAAPLGGLIAEDVLRGTTVSAAAEVVVDFRGEDGQGAVPGVAAEAVAAGAVVDGVAAGGADSGDF